MTPLDDRDFDRLLREAMQAVPEHPGIANLSARAMQRARMAETGVLTRDAVRLARYSLIYEVLTVLTAAAVIALVAFTADHVSLTSTFGMSETPSAAAGIANETPDILQALQSEQMALTAIGMVLVLSVFLVIHFVLSSQSVMVISGKMAGSNGTP